ncbi:hypothetical protein [Streptomyces sp. NPDC005303]|uniref:hypothetical protein n=1 Tax=Streptomyces sp. NPDC005303 TaxID=3155713 RepID=UPI0033B9A809
MRARAGGGPRRNLPPPYDPYPLSSEAPERAAPPESATRPRGVGADMLTALSIAGLVAMIIAAA